ncbi:hypothetical protein EDD18DRAFT_1364113 [Armillaria luteobubalina]|uniref:Uncharacterized protein n=1 Tax=Armillaria luteobubalina TaxID=153913 RepID=A0AA39P9N3_9AGAR|nr:hypothetical protein EDD18DRAFT_1364113 [Armillaria luteobubalina]
MVDDLLIIGQHIYDVMGCAWNMPANYGSGVFESCQGDSGQPMGVYGTSTFHQGDASTPDAHPVPSSSQCTTVSAIGGGSAVLTGVSATTTATSELDQFSDEYRKGLNKHRSASSTGSAASAASSPASSTGTSNGGLVALGLSWAGIVFVIVGGLAVLAE